MMTATSSLFKGAARGSLIGFLGGLFTAMAMLLFLFAYSAARPAADIGSTAILAPLMGGICSMVFGIVLGAIGGVVAELAGFSIKGPRRCSLFGGIVLVAIGLLGLLASFCENPDRFLRAPILMVGLSVFSGALGGASSGTIVGIFLRR